MRGTRFNAGVIVAVAAAALLSTTLGFAQVHRHQMRHHRSEGFGPGFLLGRMVERLDLTEAQQEQIQSFMEAHHQVMGPLMTQVYEARQEVARRIHAPMLDEAAIRDATAAVGTLEAEVAVERARALRGIREVLTPEQQAELEEMLAEMHAGFGPGDGPGAGPHHMRRRAPAPDH